MSSSGPESFPRVLNARGSLWVIIAAKDFLIILIKLEVGIGSKFAISCLKSFGRGAHWAYIAAEDLSTFIIIYKVRVGPESAIINLKSSGHGSHRAYIIAA